MLLHPRGTSWIMGVIRLWIRMTGITCSMTDDSMSLVLLTCHTSDAILGHIPFRARSTDLQGVACLSPLARCTLRWLIGSLFYDGLPMEPLWSHSVRPTFLGIWLSPCFLSWETFPSCLDLIWITEVTCSMIDDSMSPGFWPTIHSDAILGHISVSDKIYGFSRRSRARR